MNLKTDDLAILKWIPFQSIFSDSNKTILFTFPYAGSGASVFQRFFSPIRSAVDLFSIQLPGREERISDSFYSDFNALIDDLTLVIEKLVKDRDYIFFGHSMGGLISYFLAQKILEKNIKIPKHIIISAIQPPHYNDVLKDITKLSKNDVKNYMRDIGGTPKIILDDDDLMQIYLNIFIRDINLIRSRDRLSMPINPIPVPMTILAGEDDFLVPIKNMESWKSYSTQQVSIEKFSGGHFFIQSCSDFVHNKVIKIIRNI